MHHAAYNNLKNVKRRLGYLQYIDALAATEHSLLHSELASEVRYSQDYES